MTRAEIIMQLADVIGKWPCTRCKLSMPPSMIPDDEGRCSRYDCRQMYRQEAMDVVDWLRKHGIDIVTILEDKNDIPRVIGSI